MVQLAYPGKLYITDHNSCFKSEVEDTTLILPHSDVTATEKLPSSLDGDAPPSPPVQLLDLITAESVPSAQ